MLVEVRESVQESLGFSPFELVFGHSLRGPLQLLKETLSVHMHWYSTLICNRYYKHTENIL